MASFLPRDEKISVLEPTPGKGNLQKVLKNHNHNIELYSPKGNYFEEEDYMFFSNKTFDWVVANPPFSPMALGYKILYECMNLSTNIIALMPYLTIINGEKRTGDIMRWGLKSITHLPRSTFKGSRIQTCILEMKKGYTGDTIFKLIK